MKKLTPFKIEENNECPHCGESTITCLECGVELDFCQNCGESIERHTCYILFTTDKYNGIDRAASYTATLIIDGEDIASIHIEQDESDTGGDVAYLQLSYISKENQTETIANIIARFAKWARYEWNNFDKQSELPTLVRLLGMTVNKSTPIYTCTKWTALPDATQIKVEHLAWEFTSKEA